MHDRKGSDWQLARRTVLAPDATSKRQYFFREALPLEARNVHHVYAPIEKQGVVLDGTAPWERGTVGPFAGSIIGLADGRYRMYYTSHDATPEMRIGVAESGDGVSWERLMLGQEPDVEGQRTNRIVFANLTGDQSYCGQPQVLRAPDGSWRMYFWKHRDRQIRYLTAQSQDGLAWRVTDVESPVLYHPGDKAVSFDWVKGLTLQNPEGAGSDGLRGEARALLVNDATFVYHNDHLDRYECYTVWLTPAIPDRRVDVDNAGGVHRIIQRRLSSDGLTWSSPELLLQPDSRDPWDLQFYHLAVQWHDDWMIGSLGHYRVEGGQQTQDLELVFSQDGREWERPLRAGFIPRTPGERDSMGIYPTNAWIDRQDHWLCLYSGTERKHNEPRDSDRREGCMMAATFRKNRLLGLAADRVGGGFVTEPFFPGEEAVTVDADVEGWLRAELCDTWGRKLDGHHLMDADEVRGDGETHRLTWGGVGTESQAHGCVRLRFEFADAVVYGVGF